MRYAEALTPPGTARPRTLGLRRWFVTILVLAAAAWAVWAYAQEAYIAHRLASQASDLRRQNALLAAQNQGYHRDIQAISNGTADEEEARQNGYSRPYEKVYLVTQPPSPSPSPAAAAAPSAKPSPTP
jgi:cell division protein FtsB